jgi:protein TonB
LTAPRKIMPTLSSPRRLPALGLAILIHVMLASLLMLWSEAPQPIPAARVVSVALLPAMPAAAPPVSFSPRDLPQRAPPPSVRPKRVLRRQTARAAPALAPAEATSSPAIAPAPIRTGAVTPAFAGSESPPGVTSAPLAEAGNPAPNYPEAARRKGIEGTVILQVSVADDGQPSDVAAATSSGHDMLDAEALRTVRRWRFRPALSRDRPVPGLVLVPIVFELHA